jgi:hypothetical protein
MKQRHKQHQAARRSSARNAHPERIRFASNHSQINIGLVAEHLAVAALSALGYEVTYPAPAGAPYDLTMCRVTNGVRARSETVQVKWIGESRNGLRLQRGRRKFPDNKAYQPGDFDYLAVIRSDALYLIPFSALNKRVTITITSSEWTPYRLPIAAESIETQAAMRRALRDAERERTMANAGTEDSQSENARISDGTA